MSKKTQSKTKQELVTYMAGYLLQDTRLTLFEGGPARILGGSCDGTLRSELWYLNRNAWTAHFTGDVKMSDATVATDFVSRRDFAPRADTLRPRRRFRLFFATSAWTSFLPIMAIIYHRPWLRSSYTAKQNGVSREHTKTQKLTRLTLIDTVIIKTN